MARAKTIEMSMGAERTVRGYKIKKMPLGAFLKAIDVLQNAPQGLLDAMFPGQSLTSVAETVRSLNSDTLTALVLQGLKVLPDLLLDTFEALSGIEKQKLIDDENLGLAGIIELMNAWVEVNEIRDFIKGATMLTQDIMAGSSLKLNTGSKG